ncbi:hypothetical protein HDV63DRAFT_365460 [Trichoderma sp. SZMC 28014]
MLTSQAKSRGGETLCAASVFFFFLLLCCFWSCRLSLPKLRGPRIRLQAEMQNAMQKQKKTRPNATRTNEDFASSDANMKMQMQCLGS